MSDHMEDIIREAHPQLANIGDTIHAIREIESIKFICPLCPRTLIAYRVRVHGHATARATLRYSVRLKLRGHLYSKHTSLSPRERTLILDQAVERLHL